MKTLHLTLKKKWFDMISSGEKKEEYREIKDYWIKRLLGRDYDVIKFTNGYNINSPTVYVEFKGIEIGSAKSSWSDGAEGQFFIIKLGDIVG